MQSGRKAIIVVKTLDLEKPHKQVKYHHKACHRFFFLNPGITQGYFPVGFTGSRGCNV